MSGDVYTMLRSPRRASTMGTADWPPVLTPDEERRRIKRNETRRWRRGAALAYSVRHGRLCLTETPDRQGGE